MHHHNFSFMAARLASDEEQTVLEQRNEVQYKVFRIGSSSQLFRFLISSYNYGP